MNFFATIFGSLSGIATFSTQDVSQPRWVNLIISLVPTLIGILIDIILVILKNKKLITKEDYENIKNELKNKNNDSEEQLVLSELELIDNEKNNKKK